MAVDWQGLIGFQGRDQILAATAAKLKELGSKLSNWTVLSRLRALAESLLQPTAELWVLLLKVVPQGFEQHATGGWLELHSEAKGLERLSARPTVGAVRFYRETGITGNVPIPKSSRCATKLDSAGSRVVFRPSAASLLPDGQDFVLVEVTSEEDGAHTIVGPDTITELLTPIAGIGGVSNDGGWIFSEGTNEETDVELQARNRLTWTALGYGANRDAYESWVRSVPGVADVWIDDQHPRGQGSIDLVVMGTAGPPSDALLDAVRAVVAERQALTANVEVRGPQEVTVAVSVRVWLWPDRGIVSETQTKVEQLLTALFVPDSDLNTARAADGLSPVERLRISEDVRPHQFSSLLGPEDLYDVEVLTPGHVEVGPGEIAVLDAPVAVDVQRRDTP